MSFLLRDIMERADNVEQALEISDHFPVWAEFSVYEGGQQGRVASRPEEGPR